MSDITKYLLIVGGPTAAGKTRLAIALAKHFATEIISADSRQFYREMEIGTARPTETELTAVKHHFIADRSISEPLNAGQFAEEALAVLAHIFEKSHYAVVVGGSGLFIKALCEGLDTFPKVTDATRTAVDELFRTAGLAGLQQSLAQHDPDYYAVVDQQNPVRLQRALEVCLAGKKPYSYYLGKKAEKRTFVPIYLQPSWPRNELYARIDQRVDEMLGEGLEAEARALQHQQQLAALQTVGYQEWFSHFADETDRATTISLIKQNTRRYAKRQLTWNRRDGHWKAVPQADIRPALTYIHLVQTAGLRLMNLSDIKNEAVISAKERRSGVGLTNATGETVATVAFITLKDWGWINEYALDGLSHVASMILVHEALHRTEMPQVYVQPTDNTLSLFEQLGFTLVAPSAIPDKLMPGLSKLPVWRWERVGQLF
jgi:tRNA dimethylallyltransferase